MSTNQHFTVCDAVLFLQFPIQYQDVMVVGEPSMMGGEYGEEDERTISRVENTQFDPNAMQNSLSNMSHQMPTTMATLGGPPPQSTSLYAFFEFDPFFFLKKFIVHQA